MPIIQITNLTSKFIEPPQQDIINILRHHLRYKVEGAQFIKLRNRKHLAEYKYLYDKRNNTFPTGLLHIVTGILQEHRVDYTLQDTRIDYPIVDPLPLRTMQLREYQLPAEQAVLEQKNCIIKIPTGGGKTAIFTSALGKLNGYKRVVIVRRQLLLSQTIGVLESQLGVKVGQIGAGVVDIQPLTVAMVPTVARAIDPRYQFSQEDEDADDDDTNLTAQQRSEIIDYIASCHCLVFDECHGIAAESAQLIARHAPTARYRWGFSATPWRSDGKDILIEAATGPRAIDITASSLIEKQFLVPPHIYFLKTPKPSIALKDQTDYQKVYKELVVHNKERNEEIFKVVDQAWERYEHILILVHQIDHGQILLDRFEKAGMWAEYISGSSSLDQRKEIIRRFSNKVRAILIGSSVLDEGVDIPEITTLINAGGGKSSARYYQKIGRAIRPCGDKKRAIVVDFLDSDIKYMNRHAQERLRIIRTEALYKIKIQGES